MNIQAIGAVSGMQSGRMNVNPVFAQVSYPDYKIKDTARGDVFTRENPFSQEQKFDLACRMAAFYMTKYEQLKQKTGRSV